MSIIMVFAKNLYSLCSSSECIDCPYFDIDNLYCRLGDEDFEKSVFDING